MEDYKEEIISTRVGCLGSSDAAMLAQIDRMGCVPRSAIKRLAVCKGLIQADNITTKAMLYGDYIEQSIFEHLSHNNPNYKSNPCLESIIYSRPNVKCIDHVDIMLEDHEKKVLYLYEVKATKDSTMVTREKYKAQLFHHSMLGKEYALKLGGGWKVKLFLVHYDTSEVDLEQPFSFDPQNIEIVPVRFCGALYNIYNAMNIVSRYLNTMNEYFDGDCVTEEYLPESVKSQFTSIAACMRDIKTKETAIEEFKKKLYDFFADKGIKKVEVDGYMFTLIEPTESITFDSKSFLNDYQEKYPRKYKKLRNQYDKRTNRKGYLKIQEKTSKEK